MTCHDYVTDFEQIWYGRPNSSFVGYFQFRFTARHFRTSLRSQIKFYMYFKNPSELLRVSCGPFLRVWVTLACVPIHATSSNSKSI